MGTVTSVNGSKSQFAVNDTVFITGSGLWAEEVTVSQSTAAVVQVNINIDLILYFQRCTKVLSVVAIHTY